MREKKLGRIILLFAFAAAFFLSWGIWLFAGQALGAANTENRQLKEWPDLSLREYYRFPQEFTGFFNDHIPFRDNLITLNSMIDYYCFHASCSEKVLIGKEGWLFYTGIEDGYSLQNYQGQGLYSEEDLAAIAEHCVRQRDLLREQGREFVILIVPNKERVYAEYMPTRYGSPSEHYPALQVYNYIREHTDVRIVYTYDALMEAKAQTENALYYKTDTHWNQIGAYVGARALLAELGIDMPPLDSEQISVSPVTTSSGDLAAMLHLNIPFRNVDTEYSVAGFSLHEREELAYDYFELFRYRAVDADPRSLYVIRDSFSTLLAPYLGSQFSETYLRHRDTYSSEELAAADPDIVVLETVERYVDLLGFFTILDVA